MTTPYKPVSFTSESVTQQKLQSLASNQQWLFENNARIRYAVGGITKDGGLKMIVGKTAHPIRLEHNFLYQEVYFGTFFTVGCNPVVSIGYEGDVGYLHRNGVVIKPLSGSQINHTGFLAIVSNTAHNNVNGTGWIHWQAVGY